MQENLVKTLDNQPLVNGDQTSPVVQTKVMKKRSFKPKKLIFTILMVFVAVVSISAVAGYFLVYRPAQALMLAVNDLEASGRAVVPYIKSQDLAGTKTQLQQVKSKMVIVREKLEAFSWTQAVPVAREYYADGQAGLSGANDLIAAAEITIDGIAPYADVIGLKGLGTSTDGGKTAQDRINFVVNTIDKLRPQLDQIGTKLASAQKSLSRIEPNRYPEEFRGIQVRAQLSNGLHTLNLASELVNNAKPLLESAPYILGTTSPRKYLLLFQNDAEIRPTGGFLTGYAVIQVDKGKISTLQSDDIYKLDELFPKKVPAPQPITKYLPLVPYWYLRDMNLSPDFKVSMDTFMPNYILTKSPDVDGVIAVNTQVLVDLLKVTGPIGVPNLGTFSAETDPRCNCPQVFYELQLLAGGEEPVVWDSVSGKIVKAPANYGNRKAFLGPLMFSVLSNVMAQPKSKMPELFNTGINQINSKNVLAYFKDPTAQAGVESFNMAGRVVEAKDKDYLMIVDTNFAGAKTNIWVTYKTDQKIEVSSDGSVTKTLSITYSNPQQKAVKITEARNLNGQFRDWLRVYVPKGSELIEAKGFESGQATGEDLGKTVFEGFFTLSPGNTKQISLKYKLPIKLKSPYKMIIQKQGGIKVFPYTISINGKSQPEILVNADQDLVINY